MFNRNAKEIGSMEEKGSMKGLIDKCILAAIVLAVPLAGIAVQAQAGHPYRWEDIHSQDGLNNFEFSPDGDILAYLRKWSWTSALPEKKNGLGSIPQNDLWLVDKPGAAPRRLTDRQGGRSGVWSISWSPSGKRLAFLETDGGTVTLWVWERVTNKIRQVSKQGIYVLSYLASTETPYRWLDDERIIATVPVSGEVAPYESFYSYVARRNAEAWDRVRKGEVTASVINSNEFRSPERSLYVVNVRTGEGRRIAKTLDVTFSEPDWWLSPDQRSIVHAKPVPSSYNRASSQKIGFPYPIELRDIDGNEIKLDEPLPDNVHRQTLHYSPDGREIAFFANGSEAINPILLYGVAGAEPMPQTEKRGSLENPAKLYRVNLDKRTIVQVDTGDIDIGPLGSPDFKWSAGGELLFHAPKRRYGVPSGVPPSRGAQWGDANGTPIAPPDKKVWWVLARDGRSRPLSTETIPPSLQRMNNGSSFIWVASGELHEIDPATGTVKNLTEKFPPKVTSAFPIDGGKGSSQKIILVATENKVSSYHLFDPATSSISEIKKPNEKASLAAVSSATGNAAFTLNDGRNGLYAWEVNGADGKPTKIAELNTFLREIVPPKRMVIDYTTLNGEKVKMNVTLPAGYQPGRKYPVWVEVRYGYVVGRQMPIPRPDDPFDRLVPYTAAGYVAMFPSIPNNIEGFGGTTQGAEEGDSCLMPMNGILPAVQKLIDDGIADPDRLFLTGSSRGGWTTLCTIGQSTRFRAAMAWIPGDPHRASEIPRGPIGGIAANRYFDNPNDFVSTVQSYARGYNPTDVPWWRDGDRDRRNSIFSYADRVQTPVMIVGGDFDDLYPIAEDYFNAMVSMRKPAQFVRYWGEAHGFANLANYRDMFLRTFAWFDRWGDIARDDRGDIIWDGDRAASRKGAPPREPDFFGRLDFFKRSSSPHEIAGGSAK